MDVERHCLVRREGKKKIEKRKTGIEKGDERKRKRELKWLADYKVNRRCR